MDTALLVEAYVAKARYEAEENKVLQLQFLETQFGSFEGILELLCSGDGTKHLLDFLSVVQDIKVVASRISSSSNLLSLMTTCEHMSPEACAVFFNVINTAAVQAPLSHEVSNTLLNFVVKSIISDHPNVSDVATRLLLHICSHSSEIGLVVLMDQVSSKTCTDSTTLMSRYCAVMSELVSMSSDMFSKCNSCGIVDLLIGQIRSADLLVQIVGMEYVSKIGSTEAGLHCLIKHNIVDWLMELIGYPSSSVGETVGVVDWTQLPDLSQPSPSYGGGAGVVIAPQAILSVTAMTQMTQLLHIWGRGKVGPTFVTDVLPTTSTHNSAIRSTTTMQPTATINTASAATKAAMELLLCTPLMTHKLLVCVGYYLSPDPITGRTDEVQCAQALSLLTAYGAMSSITLCTLTTRAPNVLNAWLSCCKGGVARQQAALAAFSWLLFAHRPSSQDSTSNAGSDVHSVPQSSTGMVVDNQIHATAPVTACIQQLLAAISASFAPDNLVSALVKATNTPLDEGKYGAMQLLAAIAVHDAMGIHILMSYAPFSIWLCDRSTEHTKQAMEYKYHIVQCMVNNPFLSLCAEEVVRGVKVYHDQGAFRPPTGVMAEPATLS